MIFGCDPVIVHRRSSCGWDCFNRKLGEKIDSKVMMAVFADSMGDVLATIGNGRVACFIYGFDRVSMWTGFVGVWAWRLS